MKVLLAASIVVFFGLLFFLLTPNKKLINKELNVVKASIAGKEVSLELADTDKKRQVGLMNRAELAKDSGMLFVFNTNGFHAIWMKNTLIPLDILWLDSEKKVVHIKESAQPCKTVNCEIHVPKKAAKYVIELPAGWVQENALAVDAFVEIS